MISGVLSRPFKCRFFSGYVFQFRPELDDNRAIVLFTRNMDSHVRIASSKDDIEKVMP
jgi:hypothetical protein